MTSRMKRGAAALIAILVLAVCLMTIPQPAQAQAPHPLLGGSNGAVKSNRGARSKVK